MQHCRIRYNCDMSIDVSRIQAVCFDVDGTLSDSDNVYAAQYTLWLRQIPFVRHPDHFARRLVMWLESPGNVMMSMSDSIGLNAVAIPAIDWLYRTFPRKGTKYLVVAGVAEMLPRLKQRYPLAAISARDERNTMAFLENCNLLQYFDVVMTALSARHTKPYPDPILLAAKKMGVSPQNCVMIGDTTVDIRAGKSAGAQTVSVLCGFGEEPELRRLKPDLVLQTTADVEAILLSAPGTIADFIR
jgi:HAD superfamily hydrolase (TIGR01549 family)